MTKRILVGIDGSDGAGAALRWAAGAARALGQGLEVVTVIPPDASADEGAAAAARLAGEWTARARDDGLQPTTTVLRGDPRQALVEAAGAEGVLLSVVGSTGTGWFPALHLGSVGHHLVQHAPGPVAVIPADSRGFEAGTVILGLDGSAGSEAALRWCTDLPAQGRVLAVHAHVPAARAGSAVPEPGWEAEAADRCRQWAAPLAQAGRLAGVEVVADDPARAVAGLADRHGADLVVIGARGAGGFTGLRLGSVALRLLHHAERPTVVVPPQDT